MMTTDVARQCRWVRLTCLCGTTTIDAEPPEGWYFVCDGCERLYLAPLAAAEPARDGGDR